MAKKVKYYTLARGYAWKNDVDRTVAVWDAKAEECDPPGFRVDPDDPCLVGQMHKVEPVYEDEHPKRGAPKTEQRQVAGSPQNRSMASPVKKDDGGDA